VVQAWEALGERPPLRGQGWARFRLKDAFGSDDDGVWNGYLDAIEGAFPGPDHEPTAPRQRPEQTVPVS
jgi:hypothetical protein